MSLLYNVAPLYRLAEYHEAVEAETERLVVPEEPGEFLRILTRDTRNQVEKLGDAVDGLEEAPVQTELEEPVTNLETELDGTRDRRERSRGGVFQALPTVLDADFATRIQPHPLARTGLPA